MHLPIIFYLPSGSKMSIIQLKGKPTMKPNSKYTDLYQTISELTAKCEAPLLELKEVVETTTELKKSTKSEILAKVQTIFAESNAIVKKLGNIGKVK